MSAPVRLPFPPDLQSRVDTSHACYALQATEVDAASNIVSRSPHTQLKLLPNHGLSRKGELEGFLFLAHHEDRATVVPFPEDIFNVVCLYDVSPPLTGDGKIASFNGDVLHILNNLDDYDKALTQLVSAALTARCCCRCNRRGEHRGRLCLWLPVGLCCLGAPRSWRRARPV